ncbi:MAG: hypothetical protein ACP5MJ_20255 [Roseiflexus sp.]
MSDTYRRYRAIQQAIMQWYHPRPIGHRENHWNTLTALICGLTGGKPAHLPTIANHAPSNGARQERLGDRFRRRRKNDRQTIDGWFVPVAKELLTMSAAHPLRLVMDGRVAGRGCLALMVSLVRHVRALPRCWAVVSAPKGRFPQATRQTLRAPVAAIMPKDATVIVLGDGAFDGTDLHADLRRSNRLYVRRTAANIPVSASGVPFHGADVEPPRDELRAVSPTWNDGGAGWFDQPLGDLGAAIPGANLSGHEYA